jgi:hypothetical protein
MDWIDLAQVRDQWRSLVDMVMNLGVPLAASKEGLRSRDLVFLHLECFNL